MESIYADEVNQFLEKMASVVDGKGKEYVIEAGWRKKLPFSDDWSGH